MDRRADKPHDLTEDETMSQTEKRLFLIRFLLDEQPVYQDIKIRSEEHTSELQSRADLVCRLLLEKKKNK